MAIVSVFVSLPPYFLSGLFIVYLPSLRSQSSWLLVFQLFVLFFISTAAQSHPAIYGMLASPTLFSHLTQQKILGKWGWVLPIFRFSVTIAVPGQANQTVIC